MSNAAQPFIPSFGLHDASRARENVVGVAVATMMRSMSCGAMRAAASAVRLASTPRSLEACEGSGDMTLADPVRVRIHSSVVSICLAKSSLVTTFGGK